MACSKISENVKLYISRIDFPFSLIAFELDDLNIILGMNWINKYEAQTNCKAQEVRLRSPDDQAVILKEVKLMKVQGKISR